MKTAIYIEDGVVQLVITPESDFEKNALTNFTGKELDVRIFSGSFYDCRGGWVRQYVFQDPSPYANSLEQKDQSIILNVREEKESS